MMGKSTVPELRRGLRRAAKEVSSRGALNYQVTFGLYNAPEMGLNSVPEIVRAALGDSAVLGGVHWAAQADVL